MNQDTKYRFIAIVVFSLICVYIVAPIPNKPAIPILSDAKLKLGIDLDGGAELRYRVLYDSTHAKGERKGLTQKATDVIRHRIEQKKTLTEAKINAQGDDEIVIQLPGVDQEGLKDFKRLVETAGKLELFAVAPREEQVRYNEARAKDPASAKPSATYRVVPNADRHQRVDEYEPFSKEWIVIEKNPIIDGSHLTNAGPQQSVEVGGVSWVTSFELNAEGAKLFDEAAAHLYDQKPPGLIAIMLDNKIESAPAVRSPSFRGHGQISGAENEKAALNLAIILKSGKLPAPLGSIGPDGKPEPKKPESELFVGPTLGQDAIRRGVIASGTTIVLVALFMLVYYRKAGFVAVVTLALNLAYLLAIMSFFHATMTLPGIAGIVLTVGMAVDANILIYERIREEQAKGKTASQAYEAGHERAFSAIVDANITTLVAALVLYWFGTGPVQGFAVSLSIGIATTLFSVLVCGKIFLKMMVVSGTTEFKMMKLMSDPKLDYLKVARVCAIGSALLVAAGMVFTGARGRDCLGIDFRGGSMLSFATNQEQPIEAVRARIQSIKAKDGTAKYGDAEIQTVGTTGMEKADFGLRGTSKNFQLRTAFTGIQEIKIDLQEVFKDILSHEPFNEMLDAEADPNPRKLPGGVGPGWWIYVQESAGLDDVRKKVAASLKDSLEKDDAGEPAFLLSEAPGAPKGLKKLKFEVPRKNAEEVKLRAMREKLQGALGGDLAKDPFLSQGSIGPAVASRLVDDSFWAMIISWALMIIYIAFRFDSWKFGVAAVAALIHDAILAIAVTALAGALIPKSWGLSFEMNLTSLAAILTVIGYSINDTIVIFDRIRENLGLMKKATFAEIINASVNQTMSRTILTSFTVWISAMVLYFATMNTGGGIAEFAFPLIVGVIAGTYSTIYIASPIVLWWHRGQKPVAP